MDKLNELEESQFKADFMITDGYIKFSSELLRLSLIAMGGFGTLLLIRLKDPNVQLLEDPRLFLISMVFFALCSAAALFHRFYASDTMSWYVSWLRADKENKTDKAERERKGLRRFLKRSEYSLIASEWLFGGGVLFFILAILNLFDISKVFK